MFDNRAKPPNAFMATRTDGRSWNVGVRTDTLIGLHADASFATINQRQQGISPLFNAMTSYEQPVVGLTLTQSLWRNSFGRAMREKNDADRATSRKTLIDARFRLKNLLLSAENTYWSLVSYTEVIRLQQENVDRARRLRDYMKQKVRQRLMDDVDYLQAEVSYESRELEHKTSLDARAVLARSFNTLRGADSDATEPLSELPKGDLLMKTARDPSKRMSREDFRSIYEGAKISEGMALSAESMIAPKLDLVGSISSNPLDGKPSTAHAQALEGRNPNWTIGVQFSIPLDYRLIKDMRRSYRVSRAVAADKFAQAEFEERRAWDDLLKQNLESQERFEKATSIEKISSQLVERERQRCSTDARPPFRPSPSRPRWRARRSIACRRSSIWSKSTT